MIIKPVKKTAGIEIIRGPNIGEPPRNVPLADSLSGEIAIKIGDKITTDHIMPAGDRLKYRSNIKKYSQFVFEGVDPDFSKNALKLKDSGKAVFIVAGESYGQGSSREHAAMCPMYLGVKAVIAKSFERIHAANLVNFGILPLVFANASDYDKLAKGASVIIDGLHESLKSGKKLVLNIPESNARCIFNILSRIARRVSFWPAYY